MEGKEQFNIDELLKTQSFTELNPMQNEILALDSRVGDIILLSPTGSGKTIAFLFRLIHELKPNTNGFQAIIIAPARELVLQIETVFKSLKTGFSSCVCYGGHNSRIEQNRLSENPDVIIGTPGRITDHILKGKIRANDFRIVVLDEFDKSLEMGFHDDFEIIFKNLPGSQKHILTSATTLDVLPSFIPIKNPIKINYLTDEPSEKLKLSILHCSPEEKAESLMRLVAEFKDEICIIFCNHREAVERLSKYFNEIGFANSIFHGAMEQTDRERNLIKFRSGAATVLISTDLAARGLDIPEVRHVVHYQLPVHEDAFIHRNGRTARMHAHGKAYLIVGSDESSPNYLNKKLPLIQLSPNLVIPALPEFELIYFSAGKKEKISKGDVVGLLLKKGGLQNDEIGLITITDMASFAAVKRTKIKSLLHHIRSEKLKKSKVKIQIAK
jgi:superfamily II DNA/RNA helicase